MAPVPTEKSKDSASGMLMGTEIVVETEAGHWLSGVAAESEMETTVRSVVVIGVETRG
jgi:hypothetical protein